MSIASRIAARSRKPSATVYLSGQRCYAVLSLRASQSFGQGVSSGTVVLRNPPLTPAIGQVVTWSWGYDGYELKGFTGTVTRVRRMSYPARYELEVRDALDPAQRVTQAIATSPLNSITAKAAIDYILETYPGITRKSIPNLEASGSAWVGTNWKLGILTPVSWTNTTALQACQDICNVLGYWLYADASGIVRAVQMERKPASRGIRTFIRGTDLLVTGAPERESAADQIRNRVVVRGANTGVAGAQITDVYQTNHQLLPAGVYQTQEFSSPLIEYVNASEAGAASAETVAQRILALWSRTPNVIKARVKADPRLSVGATVGITDSGIGYSAAQMFFIYGLETTLDLTTGKFDQNLTLDGGTGNSGYTTIPNPLASFTWTLMTETTNGTAVVEVFLDGSGSQSLADGVIVTYAWSTATTTYSSTANTASGAKAAFVFPASAGTASITLTVTDTTSKTGTLTQVVDLTGDELTAPITRTFNVAFGSAWYASSNGGATWNTETTASNDAVAVPEWGSGSDPRATADDAQTYGLIATRGVSGTGLRRTLNALQTASSNLASIGSAITMVWQNEAFPARVWAAVGSTVRRSIDGGATFSTWGTLPATVRWIIEDPALPNSVFVLAGNVVYNSTSATAPGTSWGVLFTGSVSATGRHMVRSKDGTVTWVCYSDSNVVERIEGGSATVTGATGIRALALSPGAAPTLYIFDDQRKIWSANGTTGASLTASAQAFPVGSTAQHALHDPDVDMVYAVAFDTEAVGTGAVYKYVPSVDALLKFKAGATGHQAHQIGIGGAGQSAYELLIPTTGATAGNGGVYQYVNGTWTLRSNGLPSVVLYCVCLAVSPFNPDWWLAIFSQNANNYVAKSSNKIIAYGGTYSPVWRWDGTTWTEVVIETTATVYPQPGGEDKVLSVAWSDTTADLWWVILNGTTTNPGIIVWAGSGTAASSAALVDRTSGTVPFGCSGAENELVLIETYPNPDSLQYMTASNTLTVVGTVATSMDGTPPIRIVGSDRGIAVIDAGSGDLYVTTDYHAAVPTWYPAFSVPSVYGQAKVASATHGTYTADGMATVNDILGTPTPGTLIFPGASVSSIASDPQTRTIVAALDISANSSAPYTYVYDGTTAVTVTTPAGVTTLASWIVPIVREL